VNPQVAFAKAEGATNNVPSFIRAERAGARGEVREERRRHAGRRRPRSVHDRGPLGRAGCVLAQPDFERELARRNVIFRIPTRCSARA